MKFRKKPVVIDAVQWDGDNLHAINEMAGFDFTTNYEIVGGALTIHTIEGDMHVSLNDFVIKGIKGEMYPCKPDIFAATYEQVRAVAHYPDGMGEESRRLHREYNALVAAQRTGAKNGREVVLLTDEANAKGIILVAGGERL